MMISEMNWKQRDLSTDVYVYVYVYVYWIYLTKVLQYTKVYERKKFICVYYMKEVYYEEEEVYVYESIFI